MRIMRSVVITAVLLLALSAPSFGQGAPDWSQYVQSDIDEIVTSDGIDDAGNGGGVKIWPGPRKIRLNVTLAAFPEKCDTQVLRRFLGMIGISLDNIPPITTCIKFKSRAGRIFTAYIQDQVGEFLPKEMKVGQPLLIYTAYVYIALATQTPGLVVNEFDASPQPIIAPDLSRQAAPGR